MEKENNDSSIISQSGEIFYPQKHHVCYILIHVFYITDPLLLEVTLHQLNETVLHLQKEVEILKSRIEVLETHRQTEDYLPYDETDFYPFMQSPAPLPSSILPPPPPSLLPVQSSPILLPTLPLQSPPPPPFPTSSLPPPPPPPFPTSSLPPPPPPFPPRQSPVPPVQSSPLPPNLYLQTSPSPTSVQAPPPPPNYSYSQNFSGPSPIVFRPIPSGRPPLSSCEIESEKLIPPADTIQRYIKLKTKSKASTLAVKLARDSIFGLKVLKMCTVAGGRGLPALPVAEVRQLKETIFHLFPDYWNNPIEFEPLWMKCIDSVNQCCKGLRAGKN